LNTLEAYERWAATYPPTAHNPVMRAEQSVVEPLLWSRRARCALDLGTGSGRYVPILAATGAHVVAIDFSWAMLTAWVAADLPVGPRPPLRPAQRVCGDARRLPFRSGSFDLINASLMVGDIADLDAWAREVARVLADGGHLVYSDFHPVWAEYGWRRTFVARDGVTHDVAIHAHTIDQHLCAIESAGLRVAAIHETRLRDERDRAVDAFRKKWGDPPVVVIFHATQSGEGRS
jgi:malonyl-CoA O-methyltransferase